jgi:hypothetical protein
MYKVIVLAHALKGNRVAKFGDVVSESELNGNAVDLVKYGFLEKVEGADAEAKAAEAKAGDKKKDKK